jgi:hypothetical protein
MITSGKYNNKVYMGWDEGISNASTYFIYSVSNSKVTPECNGLTFGAWSKNAGLEVLLDGRVI